MNARYRRHSLRLATSILGVSLLMVHHVASAGTIQGVTAQPSSASTGDPIVVTVTGTGTCANGVVVNFGDGDSQEKAGDLPLAFNAKSYSQSGTYTVSAAAKPGTLGCNGSASTTVNVTKPGQTLMELCVVVGCGRMTLRPQIDSQLAEVTPEGTYTLTGRVFGDTPGKVYLKLYQPLEQNREMQIQSWSDTSITAQVPDLSYIPDHDAAIFVQTSDGGKSALQSVNFVAKREVRLLTMNDPEVSVNCSHGGNHNTCNHHSHSDGICSGLSPAPWSHWPNATFYGGHKNCDRVFDWDTGTDTLKVELANGFEIFGIAIQQSGINSVLYDSMLVPPTPAELAAAKGSTSWTANMNFWVPPDGFAYIQYGVWVYVIGPKGIVSH